MTNTRTLPIPFIAAVEASDFVPVNNGLTVSRLADAPQVSHLKRLHNLKEDSGEKIWTLITRGIMQVVMKSSPAHGVYDGAVRLYKAMKRTRETLRSMNPSDEEATALDGVMRSLNDYVKKYHPLDEERFMIDRFMQIEVKVSIPREDGTGVVEATRGVFDNIPCYDSHEKTLYVIKSCSTAAATKPQMRTVWEAEANMKAFLLQQNGYEVTSIITVMLFKDWHKHLVQKRSSYPSQQILSVPLQVFPIAKVEAGVKRRVVEHVKAEEGNVPPCSDRDRWKVPDSYALWRPVSNTIAKGEFHTIAAAEEYMREHPTRTHGCEIRLQEGESRRCKEYCPVREVCPQWKSIQEARTAHLKE
jgi:hypothetical protein